MNAKQCRWAGYEDGFSGEVCRDHNLTGKEAIAYRQGFAKGSEALRNGVNELKAMDCGWNATSEVNQ